MAEPTEKERRLSMFGVDDRARRTINRAKYLLMQEGFI